LQEVKKGLGSGVVLRPGQEHGILADRAVQVCGHRPVTALGAGFRTENLRERHETQCGVMGVDHLKSLSDVFAHHDLLPKVIAESESLHDHFRGAAIWSELGVSDCKPGEISRSEHRCSISLDQFRIGAEQGEPAHRVSELGAGNSLSAMRQFHGGFIVGGEEHIERGARDYLSRQLAGGAADDRKPVL